ncbi:hypothetical protein GCM10011579_067700 [Streptomyces albiflavescens]|uniref:Magnesium transporter CorA n=2 Tax=Streptomyces albiflavescens TaxID=1623582 RepID=A0A917Y9P6_9ACTN|nr:hypothetical protein GCM10011579_067700 [Streptomyces albiflavescens]
MNFNHVPELRWRFVYPTMLIATTALVTLVHLVFCKRRWL